MIPSPFHNLNERTEVVERVIHKHNSNVAYDSFKIYVLPF